MAHILIVDDERVVRAMVRGLGTRMGHKVSEGTSLLEGLGLAADADLVLLNMLLPDGDALSFVDNFTSLPQKPEVIVLTAFGHAEGLESALLAGALDYLVKPLHLSDLEKAIAQALKWREQRRNRLEGFVRPEIVGESRCLKEALAQLAEAATSNVGVLLMGETGVGKELFARALHRNSQRRLAPCITVDCAALPPNLLEAQLFGHAKGAFTGADRSREGLLRAADGGSLFLDEVGELPADIQGTFLRALDVRRFRPVGETCEVNSDFRLVAATNKNLEEMARCHLFRTDLLFRLQGMTILVPPLRRRQEDIPLLVEHFMKQAAQQSGMPRKYPDDEVLNALCEYAWPGNIREMKHVMESACAAAGADDTLRMYHLPRGMRIALSRRQFNSYPSSVPRRDNAYTSSDAIWDAACGNRARRANMGEQVCVGEAGKASFFPQDQNFSGGRDCPANWKYKENEAQFSEGGASLLPTLKQCKENAEAAYLLALMNRCGGDVPSAAHMAGLSRGHLYELLRRHGMSPRH